MFWRKPNRTDTDVMASVIESAAKLLASSFEAEAQVRLKRVEHEVELLRAEREEKRKDNEMRAALREKQRGSAAATNKKRWGASNPRCPVCLKLPTFNAEALERHKRECPASSAERWDNEFIPVSAPNPTIRV